MADRRALLVLGAALAGCASGPAPRGRFDGGWFVKEVPVTGPRGEGRLTVRYRAGVPGAAWRPTRPDPGDFAFTSGPVTLYADSSCGARYDDAPLSALLNHLTVGFTEVRLARAEERMLDGRAALTRWAEAKLDGVPVGLTMTVVKKGACVYDLVALGPADAVGAAEADYLRFRDGFEARD